MTDTEPRPEAQPAEGHTWEGRHDRAEDQQPDSGERHAADRFLAEQDPEDAERVAARVTDYAAMIAGASSGLTNSHRPCSPF